MTSGNTTGPLPSPFNRLVGSWQVQRHFETEDQMLMGEVVFMSLFDGHGAQDVWTVPEPRAWAEGIPTGGFRGTTVYSFDGAANVLHSVWIDPDQHLA